jgi:hypothetical protein
MGQRAYCDQSHPGGDAEADRWCEDYHRPVLPALILETVPEYRPPTGPDASGLIFLPVLPEDLETILDALGTAAGDAADRDGPARWEPFAELQTKLSAYRPGGRHE